MIKKLLFTIPLLIAIFTTSCSENYNDVTQSDFRKTILPNVDINRLEIENNEEVLIFTDAESPYRIRMKNSTEIQKFVEFLNSNDENISIHYTTTPNGSEYGLFIWQMLYLIFPIIILSHIVLLWISLRKIIKSKTDNSEKIFSAIISIFFPFFGPLIYLTTKQKS
jgi:ATP-dependent Zn protease